MAFKVRPGIPGMRDLWNHLFKGLQEGTLDEDERRLARKLAKTVRHLSRDPAHPGLHTHGIEPLTKRYGTKVFQSYLENNTPGAGRVFWVYGPNRREITLIGLEPHPEDSKRGAYDRVSLSALPER